MAISEISSAVRTRRERQAWAEQVLAQAERQTGVKRESFTLNTGFYEQAPRGVCEALGIPMGGALAITTSGSTSILLAMVAEATASDAWVAVVGLPSLGMAAAADFGIDLARLVLVSNPGTQAPRVLAALIDGFDAVIIGREVRVNAGQRRSLLGRARNQRTVVFAQNWPESTVRVEAAAVSWRGVGEGEGYLSEVDIDVRKRGQGGERSVRLSVAGGRVARAENILRSVG